MKIIFYELIRMLLAYEKREECVEYESTRSISKIEGYQDLTNKLFRYSYECCKSDVNELKMMVQKIDGRNNNKINMIESKLEERLSDDYLTRIEDLEKQNKTLLHKIQVLENYINKGMKENHFDQGVPKEIIDNSTSSSDLELKMTQLQKKIGDIEDKFESMKEDFETQDQIETLKNDISVIKASQKIGIGDQ